MKSAFQMKRTAVLLRTSVSIFYDLAPHRLIGGGEKKMIRLY